jgi:thiol-disulfide isomerase/thioredoxin
MVSRKHLPLWVKMGIFFAGVLLWIAVISGNTLGKQIVLKVVGPEGETLSGAKVYQRYRDYDGQRSGRKEYTCDTDGLVNLAEDEVFKYEKDRKGIVLYGLYKDRLAGIVKISTDDLGKEVTLKLTPACKVFGKIASTELNDLGQKVSWTNIYVYREGKQLLSCSRKQGNYEILLPSGKYKFNAYGNHLYPKYEQIEITSGQKELEKNFDLQADRLTHLIGKKAPELQQIQGWLNSKEIKLEDLRGKVVLLDFWGYWCGPCVAGIPKLIDLHENYRDKGLVIIGIHSESMESIDELEKKIEELSEKRWDGRKIPFYMALDGGGKHNIVGTKITVKGATVATYGIISWPTLVLINKQGKIIKKYSQEGDIQLLEELLAEDTDNQH